MLSEKIKTSQQLKEFYEGFHGRIRVGESKRFNRWLLEILAPPRGIRLLDIACGRGNFLSQASQEGVFCYGVDISEKAISIARTQKGRKEVVIADAESLPWADGSFDIISCLGSLEHFLHPEVALAEMFRVARGDANFCFLVPNSFSWDNIEWVKKTGKPPTHNQELERFATRWEWQGFLEENGFKIKQVLKYNGFPRLFEIKHGGIKLKSLRKFFRRFFIPFNLCSSFIFICMKRK